MVLVVKNLPTNIGDARDMVRSLDQEDPLENKASIDIALISKPHKYFMRKVKKSPTKINVKILNKILATRMQLNIKLILYHKKVRLTLGM